MNIEKNQSNKQEKFIDKFKDLESVSKAKFILLFLICVFLFVLVIEGLVANRYLHKLVSGDSVNGFSVEIKTTKSIEDVFPDITSLDSTETTCLAGAKSYIINTESKKIHFRDCYVLENTSDEKKKSVILTDEELEEYLNNGYEVCKKCGGN